MAAFNFSIKLLKRHIEAPLRIFLKSCICIPTLSSHCSAKKKEFDGNVELNKYLYFKRLFGWLHLKEDNHKRSHGKKNPLKCGLYSHQDMFLEEYHELIAMSIFIETSEKSFSKKNKMVLQRFFIKNEKDIKYRKMDVF